MYPKLCCPIKNVLNSQIESLNAQWVPKLIRSTTEICGNHCLQKNRFYIFLIEDHKNWFIVASQWIEILRFCRFNRCYLWFLKVFLLFYFSMHTSRSPAYKRGWIHTFTGSLLVHFQQTVMGLSGRHLTIPSFKANQEPVKYDYTHVYMQVTVKYA